MEINALIETTIKEEFKNATTLTIAHRLNTIINSNKILVMNDGIVAKFNPPYVLLIEKLSKMTLHSIFKLPKGQ
ncbi:hypothetical protein HK101_002828 [Irineochytrium annulatum]|nr:hypothetical protein HK101_002828 [Irineochytrium annulatum]